jgi:hypothetical protein
MHRLMVRWSSFSLNTLSGGLLVSLLLHGLIAALLLFDLPRPMAEPEPQEEVVAVTIVPPPEPEPEVEPEEEPAPQGEAPPEAAAEPEPAEAAEAELPPPPALPEGEAVPIPVLRPVFEFGEEDAGPEIALDGGAAQAPAADPAETQPDEPVAEPEPEPETAAETAAKVPPEPESPVADPADPPAETLAEDPAEAPMEQPAPAPPAEVAVPDAEQAGDQPAGLPEAAEQTETALLPEKPADPPPSAPQPVKPDPVETPPPGSSSGTSSAAPADPAPAVDNGLPGVRALSSSVDTGHAVATTAMGALPRDARGTQLCTTELREQLRRAPESYRVELLPAYRLPGGTVLNVPNAAFRAAGAWYNLSFRCTVDRDALRVTDFSFKVGAPIPRAQWRQRGFPEF